MTMDLLFFTQLSLSPFLPLQLTPALLKNKRYTHWINLIETIYIPSDSMTSSSLRSTTYIKAENKRDYIWVVVRILSVH